MLYFFTVNSLRPFIFRNMSGPRTLTLMINSTDIIIIVKTDTEEMEKGVRMDDTEEEEQKEG
jgi:hypothetical protein